MINDAKIEKDIKEWKNENKKAFLKSLLIGAISVLVAILLNVCDETNDDSYIQNLISQKDSYTPFVNRILSIVLGNIFCLFPEYSWWFIFSFGVIFLSFVSLSYVLFKRSKGAWQILACFVLLFSAFFGALRCINFTRTAFFSSFAGVVLLLDVIFFDNIKKRWKSVSAALILFVLGIFIRQDSAVMALGMAFFLVVAFVVTKKIKFNKKGICRIISLLLPFIIFLSITVILSQISTNLLTDEEKEYLEYNTARSFLNDYKSQIVEFEGNEDFYAENNILSVEDINAFSIFITEDWEIFTNENIKNIVQKRIEKRDLFNSSYNRKNVSLEKYTYVILCVLILLILGVVVINPHKCWRIVGVEIFGVVAVLCYLIYSGRVRSRVLDCIFISVLISLTYSFVGFGLNSTEFWRKKAERCKKEPKIKISKTLLLNILLSVIMFVVSTPGLYASLRKSILKSGSEDIKRELFSLVEGTEDIYFFPPGCDYEEITMLSPITLKHEKTPANIHMIGGWMCRTPYELELVKNKGIDNPMRALFEDDRVLSEYHGSVYAFLKRRYDKNITASHIRTYMGVEIIKYSQPIERDKMSGEIFKEVLFEEFRSFEGKTVVKGHAEGLEKYPYLYLNVEMSGETQSLQTFRLEKDKEGNFSAGLYIPYELEKCNYYLVAKDDDGNIYSVIDN